MELVGFYRESFEREKITMNVELLMAKLMQWLRLVWLHFEPPKKLKEKISIIAQLNLTVCVLFTNYIASIDVQSLGTIGEKLIAIFFVIVMFFFYIIKVHEKVRE